MKRRIYENTLVNDSNGDILIVVWGCRFLEYSALMRTHDQYAGLILTYWSIYRIIWSYTLFGFSRRPFCIELLATMSYRENCRSSVVRSSSNAIQPSNSSPWSVITVRCRFFDLNFDKISLIAINGGHFEDCRKINVKRVDRSIIIRYEL